MKKPTSWLASYAALGVFPGRYPSVNPGRCFFMRLASHLGDAPRGLRVLRREVEGLTTVEVIRPNVTFGCVPGGQSLDDGIFFNSRIFDLTWQRLYGKVGSIGENLAFENCVRKRDKLFVGACQLDTMKVKAESANNEVRG